MCMDSPLDLTKVRLQASGDKQMIQSMKKTIQMASKVSHVCSLCDAVPHWRLWRLGVRGLFDGIMGTWLCQMSYSMCQFWAYNESKKLLGASACPMSQAAFVSVTVCGLNRADNNSPACQLALAGTMGGCRVSCHRMMADLFVVN